MSKEDYNANYTKAQLTDMCEERGIEIPAGALKADIVKILEDDDAKKASAPKAAPKEEKKEAPKPVKKEEPKPVKKEEPKPVKKEEPKKATPSPAKKTGKKPEKKVKKGSSGLKKFEDKMSDIGYMDVWDYIALGVGVWGILWTLFGFISFIIAGGLTAAFLPTSLTIWYFGIGNFFMFIIKFWIYTCLLLFPFIIKKIGMPLINKWSWFPLHFIKTGEDLRGFMIFIGFWSCVFFWMNSYAFRWPHFISVVLMAIVMFATPLSKKSIRGKQIPGKKVKEY